MAAPKTSRQLDLTLVSAKDLKNVNFFSKMDVYAVVSLSDDATTRQRTPTCTDCGRNPEWNVSMRFLIPNPVQGHKQTLRVQIRSQRVLGDRDVGEVVIPINELESDSAIKYEAYQVRSTSGKAKGDLNISYKLVDSVSSSTGQAAYHKINSCGAGRLGKACPPPPPPPSKPVDPVTANPMSNGSPPPPPPPSVEYGYPAQPPPPAYGGYEPGPPPYGGYEPGPPQYAYQAYGDAGAGAGAGYGAFPPPGSYGYNGSAPPPPPPVQKPPKDELAHCMALGGVMGASMSAM